MTDESTRADDRVTFGVLADTHVPDRLPGVPDRVLELLASLHVDAILHAGDICRPAVLDALRAVAPVIAVMGNRDLLWPGNWTLPRERLIQRAGRRIFLTHGERGLREYVDRLRPGGARNETPEATERRLLARNRGVDAIVYGHTHVPRVTRPEGTLLMNPGSIAPDHYTALGATIGLLHVAREGLSGHLVRVDAPEERVSI